MNSIQFKTNKLLMFHSGGPGFLETLMQLCFVSFFPHWENTMTGSTRTQ